MNPLTTTTGCMLIRTGAVLFLLTGSSIGRCEEAKASVSAETTVSTVSAMTTASEVQATTREERIAIHRARILKIIDENRLKREREAAAHRRSGKGNLLLEYGSGTTSPVTVAYSGVPLSLAVEGISMISGAAIAVRGKAASISIHLVSRNASVETVLDTLSRDHPELIVHRVTADPPDYEIWDRESFIHDLRKRESRLQTTGTQILP